VISHNLHEYIPWGQGELKQNNWTLGHKAFDTVTEALIGAMFLDAPDSWIEWDHNCQEIFGREKILLIFRNPYLEIFGQDPASTIISPPSGVTPANPFFSDPPSTSTIKPDFRHWITNNNVQKTQSKTDRLPQVACKTLP
jgi:hypothetical protein